MQLSDLKSKCKLIISKLCQLQNIYSIISNGNSWTKSYFRLTILLLENQIPLRKSSKVPTVTVSEFWAGHCWRCGKNPRTMDACWSPWAPPPANLPAHYDICTRRPTFHITRSPGNSHFVIIVAITIKLAVTKNSVLSWGGKNGKIKYLNYKWRIFIHVLSCCLRMSY